MIYLTSIASNFRFAGQQNVDHYDVSVTISPGVILYSNLSPRLIDGYWEVVGLTEMIKAYMRINNISVMTMTLYAVPKDINGVWLEELDNVEITQEILFVGARLIEVRPLTTFTTCFLTTFHVAWVLPGGTFSLTYYTKSSSTSYTLTKYLRNGTTITETSNVTSAGLGTIEFNYDDEVARIDVSMFDGFTLYFLDIYDTVEHFRYRNVFNVLEYVSLPASVVCQPSTEFETAVLDNVLQKYDIEHSLEMTLKTSALPASMFDQLKALCMAVSVEYCKKYDLISTKWRWYNILISEYKMDKSTNPGTALALEMTFEYADRTMNDAANLIS